MYLRKRAIKRRKAAKPSAIRTKNKIPAPKIPTVAFEREDDDNDDDDDDDDGDIAPPPIVPAQDPISPSVPAQDPISPTVPAPTAKQRPSRRIVSLRAVDDELMDSAAFATLGNLIDRKRSSAMVVILVGTLGGGRRRLVELVAAKRNLELSVAESFDELDDLLTNCATPMVDFFSSKKKHLTTTTTTQRKPMILCPDLDIQVAIEGKERLRDWVNRLLRLRWKVIFQPPVICATVTGFDGLSPLFMLPEDRLGKVFMVPVSERTCRQLIAHVVPEVSPLDPRINVVLRQCHNDLNRIRNECRFLSVASRSPDVNETQKKRRHDLKTERLVSQQLLLGARRTFLMDFMLFGRWKFGAAATVPTDTQKKRKIPFIQIALPIVETDADSILRDVFDEWPTATECGMPLRTLDQWTDHLSMLDCLQTGLPWGLERYNETAMQVRSAMLVHALHRCMLPHARLPAGQHHRRPLIGESIRSRIKSVNPETVEFLLPHWTVRTAAVDFEVEVLQRNIADLKIADRWAWHPIYSWETPTFRAPASIAGVPIEPTVGSVRKSLDRWPKYGQRTTDHGHP